MVLSLSRHASAKDGEPIAPDAVLDAMPTLRAEHDPAAARRRAREQRMAIENFPANLAVAISPVVEAMHGFAEAMANVARDMLDRMTTPVMHHLLARVEAMQRQVRAERNAAHLAYWCSLTPRRRKDILRRHRKGIARR